MSNTYLERIGRYRIMRHDELPEDHKAAYRLEGINPDDLWTLIWSFNDKDAAERCLESYDNDPGGSRFWTYKLVDAGKEEVIERQNWF